jgi:primosomal protein N'
VARLVSVFPLVTARVLARAFTYEAPPEVGKGAVVSIPFGRGRQRGVVVGEEREAPEGVRPVKVGEVLDELPPALVEPALWIADYYGSTPARALQLVAPPKRKRRKEQAPPAERNTFAGEAEPERLSDPQRRAVDRIVEAIDGGGALLLLNRPSGRGKRGDNVEAGG